MCPFHLCHLFSLHSSLFYLIWFLALSLCFVLFSSTLLISSSFSLPFLSSCFHFSFHFISPHIISLLILFFSLSSSLSLPHYLAFTPSFSLSLHIILSLSPFYVCFLYLIPLSLLSHFEVLHLCQLSLHYFNLFKISGVEIGDFGMQGFGLKTTEDLQQGVEVINVPLEAMMTEDTARKSYLGKFFRGDSIVP